MSRQKGRNGELEAARVLEGHRTSQIGQASADVTCKHGLTYEVKRRSNAFTNLYNYLEQTKGVDRLMIRDDRKPWLVVMYLDTYKEHHWHAEDNTVQCDDLEEQGGHTTA